jgi:hypothetical protein
MDFVARRRQTGRNTLGIIADTARLRGIFASDQVGSVGVAIFSAV